MAHVVATQDGDRVTYAVAPAEAERRGDARARAALLRIGPPPYDVDATLAVDGWLERLGGVFFGACPRGGPRAGRLHEQAY